MAKATKAKTKQTEAAEPAEAVASAPATEVNEFAEPDKALVPGSEMQLAVLDGNDVEASEEAMVESDPAADEARSRLKQVFQSQDGCFWNVAKDMSYIANKKAYQQWGFKTFESFLDAEFRMSKRKGQYYVQVFNYFESSLRTTLKDMDEAYDGLMDTIRAEGWTKGRVLAREQIITPGNVDEVIVKLKTCGYRELEAFCKSMRESMGDKEREEADDNNDLKTVRLSFQCSLPQKDDVEAAIELATTMCSKDTTRTGALAWACRDFVATNVAAQGKDRIGSIAEFLSKYERLLGVSLIAIDETTKLVVHGQDNLERLSK